MHSTFFNFASFSRWLDQATQPDHPYYHPLQISLTAGISYFGAACFSSIPPVHAMNFMIAARTISLLTAPLFAELLENYQDVSLVPLGGQVANLTVSLALAKVICQAAGQKLSKKQIVQITLICLTILAASHLALRTVRQQYAHEA